jgi:hypothetical protein
MAQHSDALDKNFQELETNTLPITKKQYRKPGLEFLGDLRGLTLSGSPGVTDSDGMSGEPGEI